MNKVLTLDLETTGLDPWKDAILIIGYRFDSGSVKQVLVYNGDKPNEEFIKALGDPNTTKRGHNVHFDLLCLVAAGYTIDGPIDDTRILSYIQDPEQKLGLKDQVETRLHRKVQRMEDFGSLRLKKRANMDHPKLVSKLVKSGKYWVSKKTLEKYNVADVINCDDLRKELIETDWYKNTEQPLTQILFKAEARGIQLDIPYLQRLKTEYEEKIEEIKKELNSNETFNPNSPKQILERYHSSGTTLASTDKHTLKQLSWGGDRFAESLLRLRGYTKLLGTYIGPFLSRSDKTGRLHGQFNQAGRESQTYGDIGGTATGRLSSSEPNLQNIPTRTEQGKKVRQGIIATSGCTLVVSDLKQIEPRLVAHYTQSNKLLTAFERGLDTHALMGADIYNKKPEDLTKMERFIGKTAWLATFYGAWYKKLKTIVEINSEDLVNYDEDYYKKVQEAFWQTNPEIRRWRERHISETRAAGFITTIGGRIIQIKSLGSSNLLERKEAERKAVNYLIQGSAADVMKLISVKLGQQKTIHALAWVHDEILAETPTYPLGHYAPAFINQTMCNTVKLKNVSVEADTKVINHWGEK